MIEMNRRDFIVRFSGIIACAGVSPYLNSGLRFLGRYDDARFRDLCKPGAWILNESFYMLNDAICNINGVHIDRCKFAFKDPLKGLELNGDCNTLTLLPGWIEYPITIAGDKCGLIASGGPLSLSDMTFPTGHS